MSKHTSALASLTATYTDSEVEEDSDHEVENEENNAANGSTNGANITTKSPTDSNSDNKSNHSSSRPSSPALVRVTTKVAKLVSYHDDTIASDDETENDEVPHQVVLMNDKEPQSQAPNTNLIDENELISDDEYNLIPPEPPGQCSAELQEKITKFYEKMQSQQLDMNAIIQKRKDFRNPSIYEKLIQFCDLNELGTNYPPSIYDPLKWSKESYYEELAMVQKTEMDRREKERKSKVEVISGNRKFEEEKKRKSKWDQPGGGSAVSGIVSAAAIKPAGLVQPSLTSSATGTKGTVISAFGSLPKKPRP